MSFDLTNKNISDTFQNVLQKTGSDNRLYDLTGNEVTDLRINGTLTADQYVVSSSVTNVTFQQQSGSTIFGDSADDTHLFTGSLNLSGSINLANLTPFKMVNSTGLSSVQMIMDSSDNLTIGNTLTTKEIQFHQMWGATAMVITGSYLGEPFVGIRTINPTKPLQVTGDISQSGNFITEGHITSSGNISASGAGPHNFGGNIYVDTDNYIGEKGESARIRFRSNAVSVANGELLATEGLDVTGNITASGNISASAGKTIQAPIIQGNTALKADSIRNLAQDEPYIEVGNNHDVTIGDPQGAVNATILFVDDTNNRISGEAGSFVFSDGFVDITTNTDATDASGDTGALRVEGGASIAKRAYIGTQLSVGSHITASGNISSSGTIYGDTAVIGGTTPAANMQLTVVGDISGSGGLHLGTSETYVSMSIDGTSGIISASTFKGSNLDIRGTADFNEGSISNVGSIALDRVTADSDINTHMSVSTNTFIFSNSNITASGDISSSSTSTGSFGHLMVGGGNFTSASLAAGGGGSADNLGNHTATEDLDLDGNSIKDALHITASGNISASGNVITSELYADKINRNGANSAHIVLATNQVTTIGDADNAGNQTKLVIDDNDEQAYIQSADTDTFAFGINTTTPTDGYLEVKGNISASGDIITDGKKVPFMNSSALYGIPYMTDAVNQFGAMNGPKWRYNLTPDMLDVPGNISASGDLIVGLSVHTAGNFVSASSGNISASGWVSASHFSGDGSGLSGITATADPAGSDTQVQFNDDGSTGGDAGFVYDKTLNQLTLDGHMTASNISASNLLVANDIELRGAHSDIFFQGGTGDTVCQVAHREDGLRINVGGGNPASTAMFHVSASGGTTSTHARIGIGTEVPATTLTVEGVISASGGISSSKDISANKITATGRVHKLGGPDDSELHITASANSMLILGKDGYEGTKIQSRHNQDSFINASLEGDTSNLGIGTQNPTKKLTVEGSISASSELFVGDGVVGGVSSGYLSASCGGLELSGSGKGQLEVDYRLFDTGSINVTVHSAGAGVGDIVKFGGNATNAGQIYYLNKDGDWSATDADAGGTTSGSIAVALGSLPYNDGMLLRGIVTLDHTTGGEVGAPLYLSTTAGRCESTAPGSGDFARVIGHKISGSFGIYFNPDNTTIEVA